MSEDRPSRIAFLRTRIEAARRDDQRSTFAVPFRKRSVILTQIEVRTDFPLYRVQSGRTRRAQAAYLDQHSDLPTDFFEDPEDSKVQAAQHQILLELIAERGLDKDLRDRGQWNPLVLTYDGYVLDGNRRLCALREDGEHYVAAVVLPEDADAPEIYETEVELQMAAETKAPYNWIDEALHIRYGIEQLGEDAENVAERMRMDVAAVNDTIAQLSVVDMYLDWLGQPGKYHLIPVERGGATRQAFHDLTERLYTQTIQRMPRLEQRTIREACFSAIVSGGGYNDVRRIVKHIRSRPQDFVNRVVETIPEDISRQIGEPPHGEQEDQVGEPEDVAADLFTQLARSERPVEIAPVKSILSMVSDPARGRRSGPSLLRAAEDLEAEEKEAQRLAQPLQRVQRALREVRAVELRPDTQGLDDIASTLGELTEQVDRLIARISTLLSERARACARRDSCPVIPRSRRD